MKNFSSNVLYEYRALNHMRTNTRIDMCDILDCLSHFLTVACEKLSWCLISASMLFIRETTFRALLRYQWVKYHTLCSLKTAWHRRIVILAKKVQKSFLNAFSWYHWGLLQLIKDSHFINDDSFLKILLPKWKTAYNKLHRRPQSKHKWR